MAITTYSELQTAITNWLHRADLGSVIPDFITLAEDRIYRMLRVRAMEEDVSGSISSGVFALPSDYVDMKVLYLSGTTPQTVLERKAPEWMRIKYPSSNIGTPLYFSREGDSLRFGPYPDSNYALGGIYYKRLSALADATNTVFTSHPGLWLYGSLVESAPYIGDDQRVILWEQAFNKLLSEVNAEEVRESFSGSRLRMEAL